jgi:hypothetical protein
MHVQWGWAMCEPGVQGKQCPPPLLHVSTTLCVSHMHNPSMPHLSGATHALSHMWDSVHRVAGERWGMLGLCMWDNAQGHAHTPFPAGAMHEWEVTQRERVPFIPHSSSPCKWECDRRRDHRTVTARIRAPCAPSPRFHLPPFALNEGPGGMQTRMGRAGRRVRRPRHVTVLPQMVARNRGAAGMRLGHARPPLCISWGHRRDSAPCPCPPARPPLCGLRHPHLVCAPHSIGLHHPQPLPLPHAPSPLHPSQAGMRGRCPHLYRRIRVCLLTLHRLWRLFRQPPLAPSCPPLSCGTNSLHTR